MTWAKETEERIKMMYRALYSGVEEINSRPIVIDSLVYMSTRNIGLSFFHSQLNVVEWLIRAAAQKKVGKQGDKYLAQYNPLVREKVPEISDTLEGAFKMTINEQSG